jgi:hypothetical protein
MQSRFGLSCRPARVRMVLANGETGVAEFFRSLLRNSIDETLDI